MAPEPTPPQQTGGYRLRDGWWVALLAAIACLALLSWALAPAVLRLADRPPGDGRTVSSFEFDLSTPSIDPELIVPSMLHRDMVPVIDDPLILSMNDIEERGAQRSTRLLVSDDLVIGVVHDGIARAYPLSIMHVHELVHDELGGTPILVSWHWPSGAARVLVRDEPTQQWGSTGLIGGGNALLYQRQQERGGEALHSQWLAQTITGPSAGTPIATIPHQVRRWADWKAEHPDSSVLGPDPELKKRYKKSDPSTYYENQRMPFGLTRPDSGPPPKTWMTRIDHPDGVVIQPWPELHASSVDGVFERDGMVFRTTRDPDTVIVLDAETLTPLDAHHGLWLTIHALESDRSDR